MNPQNARPYVEGKGCTFAEEHVCVDEAISGGEYAQRPGLMAMPANVNEFDVLVTLEVYRLVRGMIHNAKLIDDNVPADARLFYDADDREEIGDSPEQRIMWSPGSFAAEMERARTAQRTREALAGKARAGYSVGGRCYGYRFVPAYVLTSDGKRVRTHTNYEIEPGEAAVVRGIFEAYAVGYGLSRIARALNGDRRTTEVTERYFSRRTPPGPQGGARSS